MTLDASFTKDERLLTESVQMQLGSYREDRATFEFDIEIDARPLGLLIAEAFKGRRVYELLSINRPGDLLNYLWVRMSDSATRLTEYVTKEYNRARRFQKTLPIVQELAFTEFDGFFTFNFDDTEPEASVWLAHRESSAWREHTLRLMPVVKRAQERILSQNDFLTQREITSMSEGNHYADYGTKVHRDGRLMPGVSAQSELPTELFELIVALVKQDEIRSVSCPFKDYWLWRELIAEQVRRSITQCVEPMAALQLNGPDGGIPFVRDFDCWQACEWGGEIHIPYEGTCVSDLFIQPDWFCFDHAKAQIAPTLSVAVFGETAKRLDERCTYLLTRSSKLGEIACATRSVVGEWYLYGPNTHRR